MDDNRGKRCLFGDKQHLRHIPTFIAFYAIDHPITTQVDGEGLHASYFLHRSFYEKKKETLLQDQNTDSDLTRGDTEETKRMEMLTNPFVTLVLIDPMEKFQELKSFARSIEKQVSSLMRFQSFDNLKSAVEWCEMTILNVQRQECLCCDREIPKSNQTLRFDVEIRSESGSVLKVTNSSLADKLGNIESSIINDDMKM